MKIFRTIIVWMLVGLPLIYGVTQTLIKVMALFA